jgi:hypothetical protein
MAWHPKGIAIAQPRVAATAATLGTQGQGINSEGVESIPHPPFIKPNFIPFQQRSKLILK